MCCVFVEKNLIVINTINSLSVIRIIFNNHMTEVGTGFSKHCILVEGGGESEDYPANTKAKGRTP